MSQIMKVFTGLFMVLFMMVSVLGVLGAFFQTLHAQDFHAAIITELEDSHYARPVIEGCFTASAEAGYELEITLYTGQDSWVCCTRKEDIPADTSGVTMAKVLLEYPFSIVFFEVDSKMQEFGYAR